MTQQKNTTSGKNVLQTLHKAVKQKAGAKPKQNKKANLSKSPSKNRILFFCLLGVAIIVVAAFLFKPNHNAPKLPPDQLVQNAIDQLINQESLRFASESRLVINDNTTIYGRVEGQKAPGALHASGKVLGSDLDIYQIGSTTYRKDALTGEWLKTENNVALDDAMLLNEIDPTTNFLQLTAVNPQLVEDEFADEEKCYKLVFTPETDNKYFNQFFQDLTYTLWITMDDHQVRKAAISGTTKSNGIEGTLVMDMDFWDWGAPITIEPPVIE